MIPTPPQGDSDVFVHGGEMGARVRAFDWSATALGPIERWPSSLRTLVHMVVSSRHPMFLWWGPELVQFYNDGYRPSLGTDRHPAALGARGEAFWGDIWPIIGPDVQQVMERGEAVWHENRLVPIVRNGRVEEVYWTYSYSPVLGDDSAVGGTLVTVQETTRHVLVERRMSILRTLAERFAAEAIDVADVGPVVRDVLAEAREDITFGRLYLFDESDELRLVTRDGGSDESWPLTEVAESGQPQLLADLEGRIHPVPHGPWPETTRSAIVVPVTYVEAGHITGVLVAGLSPRLDLDDDYRQFLTLFARQIGGAVTNAQERARGRRLEAAARERLERAMEYAPAALALLNGPDHVFTLANPRYLELVDGRSVIGKTVREALPEVEGQGYVELLDRVYTTGEPYVGMEQPLTVYDSRGEPRESYVNFVYAPTRDSEGAIDGIFVHAYDVSEQVQARLDAEEAARAREEFLSIASHELRNPVAALTGTVQLLARTRAAGRLTDERLDTYTESLLSSGRHLARLTDDLLDVSRVHHGELRLRPEPTDLAALVKGIVRTGDWESDLIRVDANDIDDSTLMIDPSRIGQVVGNLLDNAVKYSPEGAEIQVSLTADGDTAELAVQDKGIGIPPANLESIFTPFGRASNAIDANVPGLGLGLYLSRRIAEQHGGSLHATSAGEGRGTRMTLRIPRRAGAAPD